MTALEGHVAMLHDLRNVADDFDEVGAEIAGVGGGVADAFYAGDSAEELEKLTEWDVAFLKIFAVAVDGLSEEGDFFCSEFGKSADFGNNVFGGS